MIEPTDLDWLDQLVDDLVRDEGEKLTAYQDSAGYWTIGVGTLIDGRVPGGGISREESRYLLQNRLATVFHQLDHSLPWWSKLDPVRRRVLANMAFNLGMAGLLGFHKTLTLIEEGRYDLAAQGMLASKWAQQVGARAKRLAEMMVTGADATGA